jgi:hypothetical protein
MDRVLNNQMQPILLEDGTLLPASGTPEAEPREVTLSEADRRRYAETGKLTLLKPATSQPGSDAPSAIASAVPVPKKEKS